MKIIKFLLIMAAAAVQLNLSAHAAAGDGNNLLLLGNAARSLGMGGTGISESGSDLFYQNPAAIGSLERVELNLGYGSPGSSIRHPSLGAVLPTSYGIMGLNLGHLSLSADGKDLNASLLTLGNARELTRSLVLGISATAVYGSSDSSGFLWLGASLGVLYTMEYGTRSYRGFGIFEPALGAAIHAGIPAGNERNVIDLNRVTMGYSFLFYRDSKLFLKFRNELSSIDGFNDYPVKFGLESTFLGTYILRTGVMIPPEYGYCAYSVGAGLRLALDNSELCIDYGLGYHTVADLTHTMGITYIHGSLDREPPAVIIEVSETHLSPNYDGTQDFLIFTTRVTDRSRIKGWKLQILDSEQHQIREYRISDREINESVDFTRVLKRFWTKKENLVVPRRILWDGTDSRGKVVPDGKYTWMFLVWDERDNISPAISGKIYVDNSPPAIDLRADDLLFSPNGDRRKDTLIIRQAAVSSPDDRWTAGFRLADGRVIKSYSWEGNKIPAILSWNGQDDHGKDAPEGLYHYFIQSRDRAGNATEKILRGISLTRQYETADINSSSEYLSPSRNDKINFFLSLSKTDGLESWKIIIENSEGKPVMEIPGNGPFQRLLSWDGKDASGHFLKDGVYYYRLSTGFSSGNTPVSFAKRLVIDGTAPRVSLGSSPSPFSPDNDGENDILTIYTDTEDDFGIASWVLRIYSPSKTVFKSFAGTGPPAPEIKWDGINESGELVESAVDYRLELTVADRAGNTTTRTRRLPVDVLVLITERGLKIRISNIEFTFDSAKLTPAAAPVLNRVADILERYSSYHVLIEGHTDDIGEEEYNLTLSEERAKAVRDYLVKKGIAKERLDFRGMGETAPFLPNISTENRRRNRRVEFILIRKDPYER